MKSNHIRIAAGILYSILAAALLVDGWSVTELPTAGKKQEGTTR